MEQKEVYVILRRKVSLHLLSESLSMINFHANYKGLFIAFSLGIFWIVVSSDFFFFLSFNTESTKPFLGYEDHSVHGERLML